MAISRSSPPLDRGNTALVITDPQNDFLSPKGVTWEMVGQSVTENKTVEHIEGYCQLNEN